MSKSPAYGGYLSFALRNVRFLGFGFLMAFASSFGQTYFIGIFGPHVQSEFGLSHTGWGTVYMIGTLASAALLPWSGKQIDRLDLRQYTVIVCIFMIAACAFMSQVNGTLMLIVAVFLLRQSGQGLMSHIAVTSMARYYDRERGRAIAIASLGFAAGEAVLPFVAVLVVAIIGWRWTYGGVAITLAIVLIPSAFLLLSGHPDRHRAHLDRMAVADAEGSTHRPASWDRAQVLNDPRFYLLLPGILAPSILVTAMFFHHLNLADVKGWSHAWITSSYGAYAIAVIVVSLGCGPMIDRLGAVRIVPFMLAPLVAGLVVVATFMNPWVAWPYLFLLGVGVGVSHTAVSAMWAEIYGVGHLGAIKSMIAALSVFGSALGPVIMGGLMDLGVTANQVCLVFAAYAGLAAVLLTFGLRRF